MSRRPEFPTSQDYAVAGAFAELAVSRPYSEASTQASILDEDHKPSQQARFDKIACGAIRSYIGANEAERNWQLHRMTTLADLKGQDLGPFSVLPIRLKASSEPTLLRAADLPMGNFGPTSTNRSIMASQKTHESAIGFMDNAMGIISGRESGNSDDVGPENYATALKLFADLWNEPGKDGNFDTGYDLVSECMDGFMTKARGDKPNFVEMTSIYTAIQGLPLGMFDKHYTNELLVHSLEQMPNYTSMNIASFLGAMGKLDLREYPNASANAVTLAMRKVGGFETGRDMLRGIRAISNLPPTAEANYAFAAFSGANSANLQQALDIAGLDELNQRLVMIVEDVIDAPQLTQYAQGMALQASRTATSRITARQLALDADRLQVDRIISNSKRI